MDGSSKPLLLLDVDGPLNVNGAPDKVVKWGYSRHFFKVLAKDYSFVSWVTKDDYDAYKAAVKLAKRGKSPDPVHAVLPFDLNPYVADNLASLGDVFDLTWATTWEDDANVALLDLLNLPGPLPVVKFPNKDSRKLDPLGMHWKTKALLDYAGDLPFVWVDDEPRANTRKYVKALSPRSDVLRITDSRGLLPGDFDKLRVLGTSM